MKTERTKLVPEAAFSNESMITREDLGSSSHSLNVVTALFLWSINRSKRLDQNAKRGISYLPNIALNIHVVDAIFFECIPNLY